MIHLKRGGSFQTTGLRTILLHHQGKTAYDISVIHWINAQPDMNNTDEQIMMALSQRFADQVEDEAAVSFDELVEAQGIFATFVMSSDLSTSGANAIVGNHTIAFPKPYRVPYCSLIVNPATAAISRGGVELFFDRVRISDIELAQLVSQAGGRSRTS